MRKLIIALLVLVFVSVSVFFSIPVFAQTYVATLIPKQPFSRIAAEQIITNSGLPIEQLEGGVTNSITRGRDAVNAYRYAHEQLYKNGWYRGISEDHTPLLEALVVALEKEGYTSSYLTFKYKAPEVLEKFWYDSDSQNAKELGYENLEAFYNDINSKDEKGKTIEASQLVDEFGVKWK